MNKKTVSNKKTTTKTVKIARKPANKKVVVSKPMAKRAAKAPVKTKTKVVGPTLIDKCLYKNVSGTYGVRVRNRNTSLYRTFDSLNKAKAFLKTLS